VYFAKVIVCHFLCSLMAFDCQEITGLGYLLTYLQSNLPIQDVQGTFPC